MKGAGWHATRRATGQGPTALRQHLRLDGCPLTPTRRLCASTCLS